MKMTWQTTPERLPEQKFTSSRRCRLKIAWCLSSQIIGGGDGKENRSSACICWLKRNPLFGFITIVNAWDVKQIQWHVDRLTDYTCVRRLLYLRPLVFDGLVTLCTRLPFCLACLLAFFLSDVASKGLTDRDYRRSMSRDSYCSQYYLPVGRVIYNGTLICWCFTRDCDFCPCSMITRLKCLWRVVISFYSFVLQWIWHKDLRLQEFYVWDLVLKLFLSFLWPLRQRPLSHKHLGHIQCIEAVGPAKLTKSCENPFPCRVGVRYRVIEPPNMMKHWVNREGEGSFILIETLGSRVFCL